MKTMISRFFLIVALSFFSFGASAQKKKMDSIMPSKVEELPEVKAYIKNTQQVFNKRNGGGNPCVSTIIKDRPTKGALHYYWIQVGVMTDERFTPELNFYVDPKTYEVLYSDTLSDSLMTLKQWRKTKKGEIK